MDVADHEYQHRDIWLNQTASARYLLYLHLRHFLLFLIEVLPGFAGTPQTKMVHRFFRALELTGNRMQW
jgi:hypothetical protein